MYVCICMHKYAHNCVHMHMLNLDCGKTALRPEVRIGFLNRPSVAVFVSVSVSVREPLGSTALGFQLSRPGI